MAVELTDPVRTYYPRLPGLDRLAGHVLLDERNYPFLQLILQISLTLVPAAIALYLVPFRWWYGAIYLAVVLLVFLDRFILMVHNVSHIPTFTKPFKWIITYINWVISPLFGHTPNTYFAHHVGMHHLEGNAPEDTSSTERFQRDSIIDFGRYLFRFYVLGSIDLTRYMLKRKRYKLIRKMLSGEVAFYVTVAGLLAWKPWPTLFVFVLPFFITRFLMMAGNWGQHAFVDAENPDSDYKNSITCINCRYNRRAYNDGYHIGHHLHPRMHWTELPKELDENRETYAKEGAIVFEGIDFFIVWAALMLKQYRFLAARYVPMAGEKPEEQELIRLFKARTRPIPRALA